MTNTDIEGLRREIEQESEELWTQFVTCCADSKNACEECERRLQLHGLLLKALSALPQWVSAKVPFEYFREGLVVVDFRGRWTGRELKHLIALCKAINPDREPPAYTFGHCYFVRNDHWFEGGPHNMVGKVAVRPTAIALPTPPLDTEE